MSDRPVSIPRNAEEARRLPPDLQAKVDQVGDDQILEDGQEEVFARAEVEEGAIEHSVSERKQATSRSPV